MDIELEDKPGGGLAVMVRPIAELGTNILSETFAIASAAIREEEGNILRRIGRS